jgi:1-acyl-sn-glycerol-3-phosphate acyltransferase
MTGKLRLILRLSAIFLASLVLWSYAKTVRFFTRNRPQRRYRMICKGMSGYSRTVRRIIGMDIRVRGTPPEAPFFLVANHISFTDILLLCATSPAWFVSNAEVADWPGLGSLVSSTNTLFIDRATRRDVHRVNQLVAGLVRENGGLVFFPEGTTSDGSGVLPFKPSLLQPAIDLGIPAHCAAIAYTTPQGTPPPSELVAWSGETDFGTHVKTLLSARRFTAHVYFHEKPLRSDCRKKLALEAHATISTLHRKLSTSVMEPG